MGSESSFCQSAGRSEPLDALSGPDASAGGPQNTAASAGSGEVAGEAETDRTSSSDGRGASPVEAKKRRAACISADLAGEIAGWLLSGCSTRSVANAYGVRLGVVAHIRRRVGLPAERPVKTPIVLVCSCDGPRDGWCELEIRGGVTLVSPEDHRAFGGQRLFVDSKGYAASSVIGEAKSVRLHVQITRPGPDLQVDHINRNKLDNRRSNLRVVPGLLNYRNRGANARSRTGVRGVYPDGHGRFVAQISIDSKPMHIGLYDTVETARLARAAAENELWGDVR